MVALDHTAAPSSVAFRAVLGRVYGQTFKRTHWRKDGAVQIRRDLTGNLLIRCVTDAVLVLLRVVVLRRGVHVVVGPGRGLWLG